MTGGRRWGGVNYSAVGARRFVFRFIRECKQLVGGWFKGGGRGDIIHTGQSFPRAVQWPSQLPPCLRAKVKPHCIWARAYCQSNQEKKS